MGEEVEAQEFSRADRTRYREKVRRCLDVFARMLREARFDTDDPMTGLEVELNLVDERGRPGAEERRGAGGDRRPGLPDRARPVQHRDQRAAGQAARGRPRRRSRTNLRRSLNDAEAKSAAVGAHMVMIGILPTLAEGHMTRGQPERQPALQAAERADPQRPRRGHHDRDRRHRQRRAARARPPTRSCPRRPAPAPSSTCRPRPTASPSTGTPPRRSPPIQLALGANSPYLLGKRAVARDPDPAVRAGHRHPQRGAQGAGRAAAGVVRGALGHLGLRPVRGERPLLPGPAADHRRRGPARRAGGRRDADCSRSCGCTTARSTAGTGRSTTSPGECRTCASRTASWPPARRSPTPSPTPPSTSGWSGRWPRASGRCGRRCRSAPPRRTSTSPPSRASTPRSTGPASARCRRPSWCCAGCCRWPARGWPPGASTRHQRPAARDHRAALPARDQRRGVVRAADAPARRPGPVRRAAGDAAGVPRADAHQRAGPHLGLRADLDPQPHPRPATARCAGRASRGG